MNWLVKEEPTHYNFADLPLWDIVFGTFRNPKQYLGQCGFEGDKDLRIGAMLAFEDVNAPLYGPGSRGVQQHRTAVAAPSLRRPRRIANVDLALGAIAPSVGLQSSRRQCTSVK